MRAMRYERPIIVRRDRIQALLRDTSKSEVQQPDNTPSDVNVKANIRPVEWRGETVAYAQPAIADRTAISGLLTTSKSDDDRDAGVGASDVRVKDNIVPVSW